MWPNCIETPTFACPINLLNPIILPALRARLAVEQLAEDKMACRFQLEMAWISNDLDNSRSTSECRQVASKSLISAWSKIRSELKKYVWMKFDHNSVSFSWGVRSSHACHKSRYVAIGTTHSCCLVSRSNSRLFLMNSKQDCSKLVSRSVWQPCVSMSSCKGSKTYDVTCKPNFLHIMHVKKHSSQVMVVFQLSSIILSFRDQHTPTHVLFFFSPFFSGVLSSSRPFLFICFSVFLKVVLSCSVFLFLFSFFFFLVVLFYA